MSVEYVNLTEIELQKRGQDLAQKLDEIESLEAVKKITAKEYADKIEKLRAQVRDLTRAIRTGEERRVSTLFDDEIHERRTSKFNRKQLRGKKP